MIEFVRGNMLEAEVEAIVNAVNCVGVMGKGIALQFKTAFPDAFRRYKAACATGEVMPGRMHVVDRGTTRAPRYIIHFPTKRHWREPARLKDVDSGLDALVAEVRRRGIESVAVPALGCGLGGLEWSV